MPKYEPELLPRLAAFEQARMADLDARLAIKCQPVPASGPEWKMIDKERYWWLLECTLPVVWNNGAFIGGDPYDHRVCSISGRDCQPTYAACIKRDGQYFEAVQALTKGEFQVHVVKIQDQY